MSQPFQFFPACLDSLLNLATDKTGVSYCRLLVNRRV